MGSRTRANLNMTRSRYNGYGYYMPGSPLQRWLCDGPLLVLCI